MKIIGTKQFEQKKYKRINLSEQWQRFLGGLSHGLVVIIFGDSGKGKTEFLLQLLKELLNHGKAVWLSYEQGHGDDLQMAMNRNKEEKWYGGVQWSDPFEDLPDKFKEPLIVNDKPASTLFQDLVNQVTKKKTIDFWFIDSIQDSLFTYDEYKYLATRFKKKNFFFISRGIGKHPEGSVARKILFNGKVGLFVSDFIVYNRKNRMGGKGEWIVSEEKAREANPLYFEAQRPTKKQKGKKAVT